MTDDKQSCGIKGDDEADKQLGAVAEENHPDDIAKQQEESDRLTAQHELKEDKKDEKKDDKKSVGSGNCCGNEG